MFGLKEGRRQWAGAGRLLKAVGAPMGATRRSHGKAVKRHLDEEYLDTADTRSPARRRSSKDARLDTSRLDTSRRPQPTARRPKREHAVSFDTSRSSERRPQLEDGREPLSVVRWYSEVEFKQYYGKGYMKQWRGAGKWMARAGLPKQPRGNLQRFTSQLLQAVPRNPWRAKDAPKPRTQEADSLDTKKDHAGTIEKWSQHSPTGLIKGPEGRKFFFHESALENYEPACGDPCKFRIAWNQKRGKYNAVRVWHTPPFRPIQHNDEKDDSDPVEMRPQMVRNKVRWLDYKAFKDYYGAKKVGAEWRDAGLWMKRAEIGAHPRGPLSRFNAALLRSRHFDTASTPKTEFPRPIQDPRDGEKKRLRWWNRQQFEEFVPDAARAWKAAGLLLKEAGATPGQDPMRWRQQVNDILRRSPAAGEQAPADPPAATEATKAAALQKTVEQQRSQIADLQLGHYVAQVEHSPGQYEEADSIGPSSRPITKEYLEHATGKKWRLYRLRLDTINTEPEDMMIRNLVNDLMNGHASGDLHVADPISAEQVTTKPVADLRKWLRDFLIPWYNWNPWSDNDTIGISGEDDEGKAREKRFDMFEASWIASATLAA
eukprot:gene5395-12626_t